LEDIGVDGRKFKWALKESVRSYGLNWTGLGYWGYKPVAGFCEHGNGASGSIESD